MLKGLSKAGIGEVEGLKELISLAADNGFHAVEATSEDLKEFIMQTNLNEVKTYLGMKGIQLGAVTLPVEWRGDNEVFKEGIKELVEIANYASKLGCKTFFTYFMPSTDEDVAPYMLQLTKRLQLIGRILKEYDMNLALEYVGPLHLRERWKNVFIWNAEQTLQWLEVVGEPNIGIVLDSFHWYLCGETVEDILAMEADRIKYVHINDVRNIPVEDVLDNDRVFPGEGVIDLSGFLHALKKVNYRGAVTQEILTLKEPTESSYDLAKKSGEAFRSVFSHANIV